MTALKIRRIFLSDQCCNRGQREADIVKASKKVIGQLRKCYSVAPLCYQGKEHFLVAAEKQDPCYLFDMEGNKEETVWEGPGGVMSMVQVPDTDGVFLATRKFYSPNDSKEASIVVVTPEGKNRWQVKTLVKLPFVHRFDILTRNGVRYLIACTLKSNHEYKDDWRFPGKVYAAVLPEDLRDFDDKNQLELQVIKEDMPRNHGYYRDLQDGVETALISAESGIFRFAPPMRTGGEWQIEKVKDSAASDAVMVDLDGDGEKELIYLAPFHGNEIHICRKTEKGYESVYCYDRAEFAHAIYGGALCDRPAVLIGHRKADQDLLAFTYCKDTGGYVCDVIDHGCGPANVYKFTVDGRDMVVAANRETDEIAMYTAFCE